MASAVETPTLLNTNNLGLGFGLGSTLTGPLTQSTKDPAPSMPTPQPPPSPPATDTDTETDSGSSIATPPRATGPQGRVRVDTDVGPAAGRTSYESTTSPVSSPPYWTYNSDLQQSSSDRLPKNSSHGRGGNRHARAVSNASTDSIPIGGIILRDNENSGCDDRGSACWAKSVEVTDHVVVNGSATNIGAFVVWNIRVETLSGSYMNIRKRYSEFDDFRWRLLRTFPGFEAAVPELPPKSLISKFRPRFLEQRRAGLQYFLNCILLNPEFSGSPVLKEFLFS
ncbi:Phox homologous domain-containing protein [Biscogniauxia mediterranea]|nr:Phox homologous domain-containing protein [Biscogniauxia mediterranea]